jgi:hypothetical protein
MSSNGTSAKNSFRMARSRSTERAQMTSSTRNRTLPESDQKRSTPLAEATCHDSVPPFFLRA